MIAAGLIAAALLVPIVVTVLVLGLGALMWWVSGWALRRDRSVPAGDVVWALELADYYGGDQVFADERDDMSAALVVLAQAVRGS